MRELAAAAAAAPGTRSVGPGASPARPQVEGNGSRASLVLPTDGPAAEPRVFWVSEPRRLVVDVPGARSGNAGRLFDLDHALVARVRVGRHPDKVRFVIETGKDVAQKVSARVQGNSVHVELTRQ